MPRDRETSVARRMLSEVESLDDSQIDELRDVLRAISRASHFPKRIEQRAMGGELMSVSENETTSRSRADIVVGAFTEFGMLVERDQAGPLDVDRYARSVVRDCGLGIESVTPEYLRALDVMRATLARFGLSVASGEAGPNDVKRHAERAETLLADEGKTIVTGRDFAKMISSLGIKAYEFESEPFMEGQDQPMDTVLALSERAAESFIRWHYERENERYRSPECVGGPEVPTVEQFEEFVGEYGHDFGLSHACGRNPWLAAWCMRDEQAQIERQRKPVQRQQEERAL